MELNRRPILGLQKIPNDHQSDTDYDWLNISHGAIIDSVMAQLIVRNLDDVLVLALKRRAARVGRSAEAEHREILRAALANDVGRPSFKEFLATIPDVGRDEDFEVPRDFPRDLY